MAPNLSELLSDLLPRVSRSFYLTLRVLPRTVRPQIGLAYLMARASDTIADTTLVPIEARLGALESFRERLEHPDSQFALGPIAQRQSLPAERVLLERLDEIWTAYDRLIPADHQAVRKVLRTIVSGQLLDVRRFAGGRSQGARIAALETDAELEDYIYRVAGCVGEFWTEICRRHVFPNAKLDDTALLKEGVSFGKGLQLVNVLRDLPRDLSQGRCYLPADKLAGAGLSPEALAMPENMAKLKPLYEVYLDRAEAYLRAGWNYTNRLPYRCARLRLACAWPVLIGAKTLQRLRHANVLDARQRVKVSRREVWSILFFSLLLYPMPPVWRRLFTPSN